MRNSIINFIHILLKFIITFATDSVNSVSEGIEDRDVKKVALNVTLLCSAIVVMAFAGSILVKLTMENMHIIIIGGFLAAAAYSALLKLFHIEEPEPPRKPSEEDYHAVLATLRPAVAEVAQTLHLAPIYSHTDMTADPEERILPLENVWKMKFKALKQNAAASIETDRARRVIQAQVKTVLYRDNPSGFAHVRFPLGGSSEPIIQIDEIKDGDAFMYIFAVISSNEYFKQKANRENDASALPTEVNTDDEDFS